MTGKAGYEVAVGDPVKYWVGSKHTYDGTVVKVGPKRVHIESRGSVVQYIRETQQRCDGMPGHFATLAQVADDEAREAARTKLRDHGLEIEWHRVHDWTTAQLQALAHAVTVIRAPGSETPA